MKTFNPTEWQPVQGEWVHNEGRLHLYASQNVVVYAIKGGRKAICGFGQHVDVKLPPMTAVKLVGKADVFVESRDIIECKPDGEIFASLESRPEGGTAAKVRKALREFEVKRLLDMRAMRRKLNAQKGISEEQHEDVVESSEDDPSEVAVRESEQPAESAG